LELLSPRRLDPPGGGGRLGPPSKPWVGLGIKPLITLYPGGTKRLGPLDGPWVGLVIELLRALYPGGSDGFGLDGSGAPIEA
jgi:hypothetical protein